MHQGERLENARTGDLFFRKLGKMIDLSLIGGAGPMPEEEPLKSLVPLQLVSETENVFLVGKFEKVEKLGASLHDGERRVLCVIHKHRDTSCMSLVRQSESWLLMEWYRPFGSSLKNQSFFCSLVMMLLCGSSALWNSFTWSVRVAHHGFGPFGAVDFLELFEHDLNFLAIGGIHSDEMKTLDLCQPCALQILLWSLPLHSSPLQEWNLRIDCATPFLAVWSIVSFEAGDEDVL